MLLGKDALLQRPSLPTEDVELPEFNGSLRIRAWTGADHDAFGQAVANLKFDGVMYAAAIAASAVKENGDRVFDMNGDIKKIAEAWPKPVLERVWKRIERLNGMGESAVEDAEKN